MEPCWHRTRCSVGLVFKDRGPWHCGLSKRHWKLPSWSLLSNLTCSADSWVSTKNAVNPYFVYLLHWYPFLWVGLNEETIHGGNTRRNQSSYGFLWSNAENTLLAASARRNAAGTQAKQLSREPETDKQAMAQSCALISGHLQQKQQENQKPGLPIKKHHELNEKY